MSKRELKQLPSETVRLISGSQVITSVFSVVKELVENSIDAESSNVEVKLDNYGLDGIEVRDNGFGISKSAIQVVAKRHHTSKISSFADLVDLCTYGFRGEAVGSLCSMSSLSITTKTSEDKVSQTYSFDHNGNILTEKPSHLGQGTTISATNLFKNVPVRRQFYNSVKKKKDELRKVEDLLMIYGVVRPDVRFILKNNKDVIWQKTKMADAKSVLNNIFGSKTVSKMVEKVSKLADSKVSLHTFLPNKNCDVPLTSRSTNDRCFVAVNKRPVQLKEIEKVIKQYYCHGNKCEKRFPLCFIHIIVSPSDIDVNVDPNKTKVLFHQHSSIVQQLCSILEDLYGPLEKSSMTEITSIDTSIDTSVLSDSGSDRGFNDSLKSLRTHTNRDDIFDYGRSRCPSVAKEPKSVAISELSTKLVVSGFYKNSEDSDVGLKDGSKSSVESSESATRIDDGFDIFNNDFDSFANELAVDEVDNSRKVNKEQNDVEKELVKGTSEVNYKKGQDMLSQLDKGQFDIVDENLDDLFDATNDFSVRFGNNEVANTTDDLLANLVESTCNDDFDTVQSDSIGVNKIKSSVVDRIEEENVGIMANKSLDSNDNDLFVSKASKHNGVSMDWSKGLYESHNAREIQPVKLLTASTCCTTTSSSSRKRPSSPSNDLSGTPSLKRRSTDVQINQPKLYDMVGKSPADKISVGFLAFSKESRPAVVEENPDACAEAITKIVRKQWEELSVNEKEHYDEAGRKHVALLKKNAAERNNDKTMMKSDNRLQTVQGLPSIKDQLIASRKKLDVSNQKPIKAVKVSFCMKKLKQLYSLGFRQSQTQKPSSLQLIGPLKFYNGWICHYGNKIKVVNPHRLEETLLYQELMENHIIPAAKLDNTIGANESCIGDMKLYETLLLMVPTNPCQTFVYIDDKRLKANGIEIKCHMDQDSKAVLEIVGLANCMPMYGIKDLNEILDLITNNKAKTVNESRPLKVKFYLQGEAVRMVRQKPVHRSHEDLIELLEQMCDNLPEDCTHCLHNKSFIHTLYDASSIPVSDDSNI
ncbi:ATP-binding mismatch repair protein [Mactra antiquata]